MEKRAPRFHGPNTWLIAREDYLGGEPAKSVCARLGIGIHAFNRRMKVEGWSRRKLAKADDLPPPLRRIAIPAPAAPADIDPEAILERERTSVEASRARLVAAMNGEPDPPDAPLFDAPGAEPPVEAAQLMQRALAAASRALGEGRAGDARTLSQMAESLSRTAAREPKTSLETILRALRDREFRIELFRIDPDNRNDPDLAVKKIYWGRAPDSPW